MSRAQKRNEVDARGQPNDLPSRIQLPMKQILVENMNHTPIVKRRQLKRRRHAVTPHTTVVDRKICRPL